MKLWILNTLENGRDFVDILLREMPVAGMICLSERNADDKISGYQHMANYCHDVGIDCVEVESYALSNDSDKFRLLNLEIDVLMVVGWQRLVPEWLIKHCRVCAVGTHGSPLGITGGRGRSPQNWALILGLQEFHISIFKLDVGVDSGEIIDTCSFDYNIFDDIRTSYYKVTLLTARMLVSAFRSGKIHSSKFEQQDESLAAYFPQRMPEDGQLDWKRPSSEIHNFVRALTKPYPGARTSLDGAEWIIWQAFPFMDGKIPDKVPGEIIAVFRTGDFVVCTLDGSILIRAHSAPENRTPMVGSIFTSESVLIQMKRIINRHSSKFLNQPLASVINKSIS